MKRDFLFSKIRCIFKCPNCGYKSNANFNLYRKEIRFLSTTNLPTRALYPKYYCMKCKTITYSPYWIENVQCDVYVPSIVETVSNLNINWIRDHINVFDMGYDWLILEHILLQKRKKTEYYIGMSIDDYLKDIKVFFVICGCQVNSYDKTVNGIITPSQRLNINKKG